MASQSKQQQQQHGSSNEFLNLNLLHCCPNNSWESPAITGVNRLSPRCTRYPYDDNHNSSSTSVQSLDGVWSFVLYPDPACVPRAAIQANFQPPVGGTHSYEGETTVPSNFTCDPTNPDIPARPQYVNVQMPFYGMYPRVPAEDNPTGLYRRTFDIPSEWIQGTDVADAKEQATRRKRMILHFGGVESCFYVYINGMFVGMAKDSRLPSEFDITSLVDTGKNTLAVVVLRWSDGCFLEQQDHWRMAGIHRSVYVYATPRTYIDDVFAKAELILPTDYIDKAMIANSDLRGRFHVQSRIGSIDKLTERCNNYKDEMLYDKGKYRIVIQLHAPNGKALFRFPVGASDVEGSVLGVLRSHLSSFTVDIPNDHTIQPWSDETPNLYEVVATLVDDSFREVETISFRVGFRCIEIRGRELLVNGRPVLIRGVNRHDHSPTGAKTVTMDEMRRDIHLMKQYNFNAIRTAHYPNSPVLYRLCDELGMLVINEANIESHSSYDLCPREHIFASAFLDRVMRMVVRDQNHPCIIGWSLGNEAGFGPNQTACAGWVRGYDDSRFIHYEGAVHEQWGQGPNDYRRRDGRLGTDVVCPMYPSLDEMKEWAESIAPEIGETRPYIMCEYSHSMGCSGGGLSDYWALIKCTHGLQGGFVWDWIDQGLERVDQNGSVWYAYGGDYGDSPNDGNFNCNGMIGPNRKPHPIMVEFKKCVQPVDFSSTNPQSGIVFVHNRRYFTTLADLEGMWQLMVGGFVVSKGSFVLPQTLPQCSAAIALSDVTNEIAKLPLGTFGSNEVHLDLVAIKKDAGAWHDKGHEVSREQISLSLPVKAVLLPIFNDAMVSSWLKTFSASKLGQNEIVVKTEKLEASFNTMAGGLAQLKASEDGQTYLHRGPRPNLFRAGTDNDGVKLWTGQLETKPLGLWLLSGLDHTHLVGASVKEERADLFGANNCLVVTTTADIIGSPGGKEYPGVAIADSLKKRTDLPCQIEVGKWTQRVAPLPDGSIYFENQIDVDSSLKDLPRVGIEFEVPKTLDTSYFFADGPVENYRDRCYSAYAGAYKEKISERLDEYVMPQEQGNRMNLRWLLLSSDNDDESNVAGPIKQTGSLASLLGQKRGVLIIPDNGIEFTVSRFSDAQLFAARHTNDLDPSPDTIFVRLDAAQRGLGSGSCGPQTRKEYQVNGGAYRIGFRLQMIP